MKGTFVIKFIIGIILSTGMALFFHVHALKYITPIIDGMMNNVHILHPEQYGFKITFFAYLTLLVPAASVAMIYYFIGDDLPFKSRIGKGIIMGFFLLLINGELIRQPIMDWLIGNPVLVVFLQSMQTWMYNLIMTIIIALIVPLKLRKRGSELI